MRVDVIYAKTIGVTTNKTSGLREFYGVWREDARSVKSPLRRYILSEPDDGRPCTMEAFTAALLTEGLDAPVIKGAISAWIKGDWQAALFPLSDDARARLTGKGGAA